VKFNLSPQEGPQWLCYIRCLGRSTWNLISRRGLTWVESGDLTRFPWLIHAFSTRAGGASRSPCRGLNLGFIESDARRTVERNRHLFLHAIGAASFSLATLKQVHSTHVFQAMAAGPGEVGFIPAGNDRPLRRGVTLPVGDALVTDRPGVLLSIRTADCLPVLIADPRRHAIAALHVGWRGALDRLAEKVVGVMRGVFGSTPRDLYAAIGPGIHVCCYGVGEEVVEAFRGRFLNSEKFFAPTPADATSAALAAKYPNIFLSPVPPGHGPSLQASAQLDLVAVVRDQLLAAGLAGSRIRACELCTACRTDLFFSHRKEGARTGRMMAVIGIRK
jgi:YfiH family protein